MKGEHEEQKKENNLKDVSKIKQSLGMSEKILENSPAAERESMNDGQDRERKSDLYQRVRVVTDKVG